MTRVYLADANPVERYALRLLLADLKMEVVGESAEWAATLTDAPASGLDMLLVEWDMFPLNQGVKSLVEFRQACLGAIVVILISHLDARRQAALSVGADVFISKGDPPDSVAYRLRLAAASIVA